jgi:tRNA A37 threonylcarbamoyladenosine dehydratase
MFTRTIQLIGENGFTALQRARVILFGVGGVGGWCAETLLRTGIGHLTLVDFDKVDTTNLNRQVVATHNNIGQSKVLEMQKRLLSICPTVDVQAINCQYNAETADSFDLSQYDIVVDAIDMVECKALLLYNATAAGCRVYASMGAGRKINPQHIRTAEFWKVQGCPLAAALRRRFKRSGNLPSRKCRCVYSDEVFSNRGEAIDTDGSMTFNKVTTNGTLSHTTAIFGLKLAELVINDIIKKQ